MLSWSAFIISKNGRVSPGAPTLVLHREDDRAAPLRQSQLIASRIGGARLVELPGRSHLPYIGDVDILVSEIRRFLGLRSLHKTAAPTLTKRQQEVADLVSQGLTNRDIAEQLGIDERSAEGHVERIRNKLGVRSRAQIATWWQRMPQIEVVLRLTSPHCPRDNEGMTKGQQFIGLTTCSSGPGSSARSLSKQADAPSSEVVVSRGRRRDARPCL